MKKLHDVSGSFEAELVALIPQMRALGRFLTGDHAAGDDLAQEALTKAWASQAHFEAGTNLKGWTFTILRNQFYSQKRRDWRSVALDPDVAERSLVAVTNPTGALELDELRRALAKLAPEQREALILVGAAQLSYDEAAQLAGCAVGTVKSRVSRARRRLEQIYECEEIDHDGLPAASAMDAIFAQARRYQEPRAAA